MAGRFVEGILPIEKQPTVQPSLFNFLLALYAPSDSDISFFYPLEKARQPYTHAHKSMENY
jgi:hypothetical protein